jgi:hypothetical protein
MKKLKPDCFTILNVNGEQVLFRTDDTSVNKLTFSIINNTGVELLLTGNAEGNPSTFTFNFETMLTAEVVEHLVLTLPGQWAAIFIEGNETTPPSWSVYPTVNLVLEPTAAVTFVITNISCSGTAPGNFLIDYRNIPEYNDSVIPVLKHLAILNPPDPKKKTLPLKDAYSHVVHPIQGHPGSAELATNGEIREAGEALPVYITYDAGALIENGFTYLLTNTSKDPLVPNGREDKDEVASLAPTLYISFLFGDDDYDITTQALADNNITIDVSASLNWQPVKHTGGSAYWQFLPQGKQIMQPFETVKFPVNAIITPLNVTPDKISIMYVQFNNVPGYNDGAYTLIMEKLIAVAKMKKFEADRHFMYIGENVSISWESSLAKKVTIEYYLKNGQRVWLDSEQGDIGLDGKNFLLPVPPTAENTVLTAKAYDNKEYNSMQIQLTVSYNLPQAQILSFTAGEMLFSHVESTGNVYIGLNWEVSYAKKTTIYYTWGSPIEVPLTQNRIDIPINISLHSWVDFTLVVESLNEKYHEPTRKTIPLRNLA